MSKRIKIVVTAETAQAAAALQQFVQNAGRGLKQMPAVAAAAGKGFEELAGKAYYVRSAIDGIRFAAADGGTRAAFYAVDEAMRAVLASGVKLTSILPVIGTISLAATAGYLIWKDYGGSMETTAEKAKRLGDELKKIPDLLANIETAQKGGNLTAAQADSFRDILSGRTPIYRKSGSSGPGGAYDITTDAGQYGTSGRMRGRWIQNPPADVNNPNDLKQAMAMIQSKTSDDNATGQIKSQNEIADLLKRNNEEALQGIAKERQEAADKYAEDKQKLLDLAVTAKLSKTQLNADLATLDADYAAKKKNLDDKEAAEKQRVNAEVQKSYDEMLAEQSSLEQSIAEQQKKETEELDKQLQLKQEIARAQIQANLDAIKSNPFLTELQKAQEEVPVLQQLIQLNAQRIAQLQQISADPKTDATGQLVAQKQMTELMVQQSQLQNEMTAAQGAGSFSFQFTQALIQLRNMNNLAKELAATFAGVVNTSIRSIGSNLTNVIMGTETWRRALYNVYNTIVSDILNSFIEMAVRWALTEGMMTMATRLGTALRTMLHLTANTTATASTAAAATTQVGAHAAVAGAGAASSQASIPYVGPILAIAAMMAVFAAVMELAHGFQVGGYTGDGAPGAVAGIVHRGEFVFNADAVQRIGVGNLAAMHAGASYGGAASSAGGGASPVNKNNVSVYSFTDPRQMADHLERNDDHEKWVVDVMGRNIHRFR